MVCLWFASQKSLMDRQTAIDLIVQHQLAQISDEIRSETVLAWFEMGGFEPGDSVIAHLPETLQHELISGQMPDDPLSRQYDPLLMDGMHASFAGVKNSYLLSYIHQHLGQSGLKPDSISGQPAPLFACPCCLYQTLTRHAEYEICPLCFWEDDGASEPDDYSSPNHMTVAQGQLNFARYGACDQTMLKNIDPEGPLKYQRATH